MNDPTTKTCTRCVTEKALTEFSPQATGKYGRFSRCKPCLAEVRRETYPEHAEYARAYSKQYRIDHPDKAQAATAGWILANPEKVQAYSKEWYIANREYKLAYDAAYRAADPIRQIERNWRSHAKFNASHPGHRTEHSLEWKLRNPERVAIMRQASNAVHRAIRRGDLVRPSHCSNCYIEGVIEASHTDYSRPLDIQWLCVSCHRFYDAWQAKTLPSAAANTEPNSA